MFALRNNIEMKMQVHLRFKAHHLFFRGEHHSLRYVVTLEMWTYVESEYAMFTINVTIADEVDIYGPPVD
jgi:hypothetical protein